MEKSSAFFAIPAIPFVLIFGFWKLIYPFLEHWEPWFYAICAISAVAGPVLLLQTRLGPVAKLCLAYFYECFNTVVCMYLGFGLACERGACL